MIGASSDKEYQLHCRIVEVIRQVSEVKYYSGSPQVLINYRDKYMAENVKWLQDYHENAKIVVWAHNFHISDYEDGSIGTMGNYLRYALLSQTGEAAFSIEMDVLANYLAWYNAFEKGMQYFFMGSGYNNRPGDYYVSFDPDLYHYMIYFDKSTASFLLN